MSDFQIFAADAAFKIALNAIYTQQKKMPYHSQISARKPHNIARTNSLFFSILEMLLTGSDCIHVISGCFDSFFRDLHAFRHWPPLEICQLE